MTSTRPPRANKARGQHFLKDRRVVGRIVDLLQLDDVDIVVEIGPGRGALTGALLATGKKVIAVEIDPRMVKHLRDTFGDVLTVIASDVIKCSPDEILPKRNGLDHPRAILVGNLPYNMGGAILDWIFRSAGYWRQVVVMLQLEVARRLVAAPGEREFGPLAVDRALRFDAQKRFLVRPGAFLPVPKVTSAVVEMAPTASPPIAVDDLLQFRKFVHILFAHRRKNLLNNLELASGMDRSAALELLTSASVDPTKRAERLGWFELERLFWAHSKLSECRD
jgi:16S rRNA (adenine1518-N6/adenine1519-N6)-dimethyltransferase